MHLLLQSLLQQALLIIRAPANLDGIAKQIFWKFFWHRLVGITLKVTDCKVGWCEPYIIENAGICIIVLTLYLMHPNYNKITLLLDLIVILVLHPLNFREWKVIQFPFPSRIPKDSWCKCVGMSTNLKRSSKTKMH